MGRIVEICCGDIEAVIAANRGGAERIELCSGLAEGGVTPSLALIRAAVEIGIPEVNVLIRPRPGDFLYSKAEIRLMEEDIQLAVDAGATGLVTGALTADGDVDMETCRSLIATATVSAARAGQQRPNITFHRAFDVCRNPLKALEDIIDMGCDCLLTSGQEAKAEDGIPMLRLLVEKAAGRIAIVVGSGVNPDNAAKIISETGVDGVHSTARELLKSGMTHRNDKPGFKEDRLVTSAEEVNLIIKNANLN